MDIERIKKDIKQTKERIEKLGERAVVIPGKTPDEPLFLIETKKIVGYCEFLLREVEEYRRFIVMSIDLGSEMLGSDENSLNFIIKCPRCRRFQTFDMAKKCEGICIYKDCSKKLLCKKKGKWRLIRK